VSQAEQAAALCEWVLQLLRLYSRHNAGVVSLQMAPALRQEAAAERGRELRALLRLLTHLTQRDLLEFGGPADGAGVDVAQVRSAPLRQNTYLQGHAKRYDADIQCRNLLTDLQAMCATWDARLRVVGQGGTPRHGHA